MTTGRPRGRPKSDHPSPSTLWSRASKERKQKRDAEFAGQPEPPAGHKERILAALGVKPVSKGLDLADLFAATGIDIHTIAHIVWSLQKQRLVTFRDAHGRGLVGIKLVEQPKMDDEIKLPTRRRDGEVTRSIAGMNGAAIPAAAGGSSRHAVGVDLTDWRNQPKTAPAGPVTRILGDPPRQNERAAAFLAERLEGIGVRKPVIDADSFPHIHQLLHREEQIRRAADMLSDAGQVDLAVAALDSIKYSGLESEVIKLIKEWT